MGEITFKCTLKVGHNVQIGYFAQNQAQLLDENLSIYDTIDRVATGDMRLKINDLLGAFMFGGETSEKRVKVLSGGERSRLAMIKLLLEPVNLLILDEPTNHLDMQSKDVLKEAIKAFDGTAIIVSHDREFLDGLVDKVYEFAGGRVTEHLGGIYDYLQSHQASTIHEALEKQSVEKSASPAVDEVTEKRSNNVDYAERKQLQKNISKTEKQMKTLEQHIASMEARQKELDALLMDAAKASDMQLVNEYTELQRNLDSDNEKWFSLSETLSDLQKQL